MPDDKHTPASGEDRGYTPSSPVKRTLAWTGLAYMVILVAMTTYPYFTGSGLSNLGPLLTVPGLIGLGAAALVYGLPVVLFLLGYLLPSSLPEPGRCLCGGLGFALGLAGAIACDRLVKKRSGISYRIVRKL